jgi:putative addiction module component (TIGR02574 family)
MVSHSDVPRIDGVRWFGVSEKARTVDARTSRWVVPRTGAHFGGAAEDRATLTNVTDNASRILDAALQLPDAERAELAAILTDSIGDGSSPEEIEASWIAEAKRRLATYRRGESTPIDLEDAMRELESKPRHRRDRRASAG